MQKAAILDHELLQITIDRLCQQLIENHGDFSESVIIGIQSRGAYLAERIHKTIEEAINIEIPFGKLDITFYRDDFRRRGKPIKANATEVPFLIENKKVILVDDVLFTGRSVNAAMDAMAAFGRPEKVELLVMIDRKYTRDLPIQADYAGKAVDSIVSQRVIVELEGVDGAEEDVVWLLNQGE